MRRIYPVDQPIKPDGGLNTKFQPSLIVDNESPDCLNVIFSDGAVGTREGVQKLNTAVIGSFAIDGLYTRHDQTTAETMVVFGGGNMYTVNSTSGITVPSAQGVFTAGVRVAVCEYQNQMFIGNGGIIARKYNGSDFTRHGVYPPTTTATVATAPTGAGLTGAYRYKFSYVNSYVVQGDVGPATSTHTASNTNIRLTNIPVAPQSFGINARRIYRTETSGVVYKLVTTIADNTTTTYDDAAADSALGATAPTDQGVPPKYSVCLYHQNRLFVNDPDNPNYYWYSEYGEPHVFKTTNFRKVGDNSSDLVKGFGIHDNAVYIACGNSYTLVYLQDPSDDTTWQDIKVKVPYGSQSPFCQLNVKDGLLFPAMQNDKFVGFSMIKGANTVQDQTLLTVNAAGSDLISNKIEPDMFDVQESFVGNISGIVYKNKAYIGVTHGSGSTQNNRVYVYDFNIDNLTKKNQNVWAPWSGFMPAQFTVWNGSLYFGSSSATGFIYRCETGSYNDDGSAIDSYYWTKEFAGYKGEFSYNKDHRYCRLLVDLAGSYYMDFAYRVDSEISSGTNLQIDLNPGGSLWGTMVWGVDAWGGGSYQAERQVFLAGARGKRIQFKFSNQNTANQRFKVHWFSYAYNLKGYR